jgi:NAD+ diphosphatase
MIEIKASRVNVYADSPLDRASRLRDDAAWLADATHAAATKYVPLWQSKSLLRGVEAGKPRAVFMPASWAAPFLEAGAPRLLLGIDAAGAAYFGLDLAAETEPPPVEDCAFHDLRMVGPGLDPGEASILAHARGALHWRRRHGFCGVCGGACHPHAAGNVLICAKCGTHHFPRTDPAVIMLVAREDRVLLGHSTRFPKLTMYSTLAGFVEPGESLEDAVRREVWEESDIRVGRVTYHSSQPWPFPGSIMLGFYAEALTDAITIDPNELTDARWFTRADLREHAALGFDLPRRDSIARRLIEDWIAAG